MNIANLPDESDSSDEDYVPDGSNAELPSEEESDGDAEDLLPIEGDLGKRGKKRQKKGRKPKKKQRPKLESPPINEEIEKTSGEKQKTDDLWADFMKDTGFKTRAERQQTPSQKSDIPVKAKHIEPSTAGSAKTVKVTQVYKFAGEEVKIEKEVGVDSPEAHILNTPSGSDTSAGKSAGRGRLSSILNQIGKKSKINTLEKSKLDWEQFKKEEDIQDELKAYSKSKDGYLERQDFLHRADVRRFEIEKEIRSTIRSNRVNNFNM